MTLDNNKDEAEQNASDDTSSDMDSVTKKKIKNSSRWKRWWLKNRESYNERRRLTAQRKNKKAGKATRAAAATETPSNDSTRKTKRQRTISNEPVEPVEMVPSPQHEDYKNDLGEFPPAMTPTGLSSLPFQHLNISPSMNLRMLPPLHQVISMNPASMNNNWTSPESMMYNKLPLNYPMFQMPMLTRPNMSFPQYSLPGMWNMPVGSFPGQ